MDKGYTRDDNGKVGLGERNVAKMNIFECMYYSKELYAEVAHDMAMYFYRWVILFGAIVLSPVVFPVCAYLRIREARRLMAVYLSHTEDGGGDG